VSHVPGLRALGSFLVTSSLSFTALVGLEELPVKNKEVFDLPFVVGAGLGFGAMVEVVVSYWGHVSRPCRVYVHTFATSAVGRHFG